MLDLLQMGWDASTILYLPDIRLGAARRALSVHQFLECLHNISYQQLWASKDAFFIRIYKLSEQIFLLPGASPREPITELYEVADVG